jgi:Phage integrase family
VDLHGAHDFRHTFATWLEDAGIPARVIDEVMGHEASRRAGQQRGSAIGAHYRHTTTEVAARIAAAVQERLTVVFQVAEHALEARPTRATPNVSSGARCVVLGQTRSKPGLARGRPGPGPDLGCGFVVEPPAESNRRPHPYHGTTGNCCADRHLRRSRPTVGTKVIGSLSAKFCVHSSHGWLPLE